MVQGRNKYILRDRTVVYKIVSVAKVLLHIVGFGSIKLSKKKDFFFRFSLIFQYFYNLEKP